VSAQLEQLANACLFPGFAGLEAPDWVRRELGQGLGGVVLFSRNVRDRDQLAGLTAALRGERADVLVAVDEEGGDVTRLELAAGSSYPGSWALGVVDDVELTRQVASAIARDLADAGVNLDLAPVADVNTNPSNPIIGVRAFGADAQLAARHVAAFVEGLQRFGIAACAKHFPGHGDTTQDSHLELPTVESLTDEALLPFRAAIEADVQAIMTAHIRVITLDDAPATLSRALIGGLLRGRLGFDGMVMTDALEMRAVSETVGVEEGAVLAIAAGADALCLGHELGQAYVERVRESLVDAVGAGRIPEDRLREAAERVSRTGRWTLRARGQPPPRSVVGLEAARLALRAEGNVVLARPPLVVELVPEPTIAAGEARHSLGDVLRSLDGKIETVRVEEPLADAAGLLDPDRGRQLLLVLRDAHRHEWERQAAEALLAATPDAVVVDVGVPVWHPTGAAGYLATHGAGRANLLAAAERLLARTPDAVV
jgi:beta-N-acetylhexosaminidase